jgi:HEXXH motif-containing protein
MSVLMDVAAGLSHAGQADRSAIVKRIVEAHSMGVMDGARQAAGSIFDKSGGLADVLETFVAQGGGWSPPFGALESALESRSAEVIRIAAAQAALWAHDCGVPGSWSLSFERPVCFRLGQSAVTWLKDVQVESIGNSYQVSGTLSTLDGSFRWQLDPFSSGDCGGLLRTNLGSTAVRVSRAEDVQSITGGEFLLGDNWRISSDMGRALDELSAAWEMLGEAPGYHAWVSDVARQILFTSPGEGLMESGSCRGLPGFVHVAHASPVQMIEMLVHEMSHQHYYLATRLGPVDDGTDTNRYWSPVKRADRPIANILLAYHAFANVILMMRGLASHWTKTGASIPDNESEICEQLVALERPLRATSALTEIGRGLFEPLRESLRLAA